MLSTKNHAQFQPRRQLADYPALAALRLIEADLDCLTRQGFVAAEQRGRRCVYKLRFRRGRKQIVRYLPAAQVDAVRRELAALQQDTTVRRTLRAMTKIAAKSLRDAKAYLKPVLECHGYTFHGMSVRRPRRAARGEAGPTT